MADAILTASLSKSYGDVLALDNLDLQVRTGEIFGYLGPNGAGKTTTIRLLLDIIRPSSGSAEVLGLDPRKDGVQLRRRVGYLPGDFIVDGRQTSREFLTFLGNLRGGLPASTMEDIADRLDFDLGRRIGSLSKGNRQKVGLIQAFMHEPELLILDEPTSGLDPLMTREFLSMATEARARGQTVFMSSHILSEIQQVADQAGIIRKGRLITIDDVDALRSRAMREVRVSFGGAVARAEFENIEGVSELVVDGSVLRCRLTGEADVFVKTAARHRVIDFISEEPDLEELFFHYYTEEASHVE
jgi:ABC-2 type transport system ATP-binding protein